MGGAIDGKVALITGTGGGQGREAAVRFAAAGAKIVGCDTKSSENDETRRLVQSAGGNMVAMGPVDLSDAEEAGEWVREAASVHGRIDILYNNASRALFGEMGNFPAQEWDFCIRNDLSLVFYVTNAAWPYLKESGGVIINTGSVAGLQGSGPGGACHAAAKGGVIALSSHWAQEGAPYGIRCVCISPGYIMTPGTAHLAATPAHAQMIDRALIKRGGTPADIAELALFLASDKASYITGTNYVVDGGRMLGGY